MIKVDATGKSCPLPIIMTKNALKEIKEGMIEVLIDNEISKENVQKFAKESGYKYTTRQDGDVYTIEIIKTLGDKSLEKKSEDNTVIVIASDKMGDGEAELGENLMKGFIYTLTEMETLPKTILLYNKGVYFTSLIKSAVEDLKMLESRGVEIISCGACINFYKLEKDVEVGTISNMYTILDKQLKATKVIRP